MNDDISTRFGIDNHDLQMNIYYYYDDIMYLVTPFTLSHVHHQAKISLHKSYQNCFQFCIIDPSLPGK